MFHRLSTVAAALVAGAILAAGALGAVVHVRVEGRNTTIFGTAEPRASGATPLEALESASLAGEFYYHLASSSFGNYVDQIGRYAAGGDSGWVFKVNGVSPPVGADKVTLKDGDRVLWYFATFGPTGGPPTLDLRATGKSCYLVVAQDDNGKPIALTGITLRVDKRTVPVKNGKACIGPHKGLVRAVSPLAIRSNALK